MLDTKQRNWIAYQQHMQRKHTQKKETMVLVIVCDDIDTIQQNNDTQKSPNSLQTF